MNVTDSIPSSDNNRSAYNSSGKSTDSQSTTSVDAAKGSDRHGYFVPLIMLIVLGVIISATFFEKSISKQVTDATSPEQNNQTAAPVNASTGAGSVAPVEITPVKSTVSDLATLNADVTLSKTTKDQFHHEIAYKAVTTDQHRPGDDGSESHAYPYTQASPYGMSGKRSKEYNKIGAWLSMHRCRRPDNTNR
jgi:hypothetical protein